MGTLDTGERRTARATESSAARDTASVRREEPRRLTLLVLDQSDVVCAGVRALVSGTGEVAAVEHAREVSSAIERMAQRMPDVLILGSAGESPSLAQQLETIVQPGRGPRVLVLSSTGSPLEARRAFAGGALGFLRVNAPAGELLEAIRTLVRGQRYLDPVVGARLADGATRDPFGVLTEREREIARLLALGHTNQEIARRMYLSVRTVETHRARALGKLGLRSRVELVRNALDHGLISPGDED